MSNFTHKNHYQKLAFTVLCLVRAFSALNQINKRWIFKGEMYET